MIDGVFSIHKSHQRAWDDPYCIRESGYQFYFLVSFWPGVVGMFSSAHTCCLLSTRSCRDILEPVLPELHEIVSLVVPQNWSCSTAEFQQAL
jgi:hypothetical protein